MISPHSSIYLPLTPTRKDLAFAVFINAQSFDHGLELALFRSSIAVNAVSHVLLPSPEDFNGLTALAQKITKLPKPGGYRNSWTIQHVVSCQAKAICSLRQVKRESLMRRGFTCLTR